MDEILVETVNPHSNMHGDHYRKAAGDTYHLPRKAAVRLMALDLVRLPEEPKKAAPKRRTRKRA